jgi:hypothetical protein
MCGFIVRKNEKRFRRVGKLGERVEAQNRHSGLLISGLNEYTATDLKAAHFLAPKFLHRPNLKDLSSASKPYSFRTARSHPGLQKVK